MEIKYILQNISRFTSFENYLEIRQSEYMRITHKKAPVDFDLLLGSKGAFFIGEPGYGKTRLLKELVFRAAPDGIKAFFIDAKKIGTSSVFDKLKDCPILSKSGFTEEDLQNKSLFSNSVSEAPQNDFIICIDALDEVPFLQLSDLLEKIYELRIEYQNARLFLSCRTHHLEKIRKDFDTDQVKLIFFKLEAFDYQQIEAYLTASGFDKYHFSKISLESCFQALLRFISTPRFLYCYSLAFRP